MWILVVCVVIMVATVYINISDESKRKEMEKSAKVSSKKIRSELETKGEVRCFTYLVNGEYFGVVDNFLYLNLDGLKGKTNIHNLLGVEVRYHVSEKNRMRFMSVMPTYDKYTKLLKIELILYRRKDSDVNLTIDHNLVNEQDLTKLKMVLDEIIEEGKSIGKSE